MKLFSQSLAIRLLLFVLSALTASPLYATDEVELIPFGSSWRWHHPTNGADPGPTFQSTWMNAASSGFANTGTAPLGYGVSDWGALAQDIGTPPSGSRHTAYFKKTISVPSELNGSFYVQLLCDDGAAIYVDGKPAGRFNFSVAEGYTAKANSLSDERRLQMIRLSVPPDPLPDAWLGPDQLSAGTHTIAVSVHNFDPTSSDLTFDLSLFFVPHGSDLPTVVAPDGRRFIAVYLPGTTWSRDEAADQAARWSVGGKLATVRSQADNTLVFDLIDKRRLWGVRRDTGGITIYEGPLIGGLQLPTGIEPSGGWTWGDNTPVTYTSWAPGEPNEAVAGQDLMRYWSTGSRRPTWDDEALTYRFSSFVIELPPPTDGPDLAISRQVLTLGDLFTEGDIEVQFHVHNIGNRTSAATTVRLELQLGGIMVQQTSCPVPQLSPGAVTDLRCKIQLPATPSNAYRLDLLVDPLARLVELSRVNNSATLTQLAVQGNSPKFKANLIFYRNAPFTLRELNFGGERKLCLASGGELQAAFVPRTAKDAIVAKVQTIFQNSGIWNLAISGTTEPDPNAYNIYFVNPVPIDNGAGGRAEGIYRFNWRRKGNAYVVYVDNLDLDFVALTVAHELGHLFGLPHLSDEVLPPDVMDYRYPDHLRTTNSFVDRMLFYCRETMVGGCRQTELTRVNPRYHLRRYINGESKETLNSEGLFGGEYDEEDSGWKWWDIQINSDFAKQMNRVYVCLRAQSGVGDDDTLVLIDQFSPSKPIRLAVRAESELFIYADGVQQNTVFRLANQEAPITPEHYFIPIQQQALFWQELVNEVPESQGLSQIAAATSYTPPPSIVISAQDRVPSLEIVGYEGAAYNLEGSDDLLSWSKITNITGSPVPLVIRDYDSKVSKFYRLTSE